MAESKKKKQDNESSGSQDNAAAAQASSQKEMEDRARGVEDARRDARLKQRREEQREEYVGDSTVVRGASDDVNVESLAEGIDRASTRGFIGLKVDPHDNSEYSQETDPTVSPRADRFRQTDLDEALADPRNQ